KPRLSCLTLAASVAGRRVETVEGLGRDGRLSAVQRGFHEKLGAQCGYCTPGFIMASAGLLRRNPRPSEDEIREALGSNIYRSTHAHAEILDVDVSAAARLPGVKAIVTGADCDKTFGVLPIARSEHPLARDKVRYKGEPVAAVAAVDDATARQAIELIRMKVRELPAYYTAAAALAPDAVALHARRPGNVERDVLFELGSVEDGFKAADLVREASYNCAEVCQNQMEMH